jgi:hypothetical protein
VESPQYLVDVIPTDQWLPVDARIKVTDVATLARNIGGEQLYGNDKTIPLRELIQNASDAIRARRLLQNHSDDWGKICIRLGSDTHGSWIEVEDTGIGMSTEVLTGPLLDFGISYWSSELMISEYPGLLSKGFQSTGRFGIGFFSVFMWGDRVRIITRRYKEGEQDTRILEFGSGLAYRPILRKANDSDVLFDGGTRIRVWFREGYKSIADIFPSARWDNKANFENLCEWLCPSSDVDIYVETDLTMPKRVVSAGDWKTLDGEQLYKRLNLNLGLLEDDLFIGRVSKKILKHLRPLRDTSGDIIGRASVSLGFSRRKIMDEGGIVTVGGLRANNLSYIFGILVGTPANATRTTAIPVVEDQELARWATEQAKLVQKFHDDPASLRDVASVIRTCGGDTYKLPIALTKDGWKSTYELSKWKNAPSEVFLIPDYEAQHGIGGKKITMDEGVLGIIQWSSLPLLNRIGIQYP